MQNGANISIDQCQNLILSVLRRLLALLLSDHSASLPRSHSFQSTSLQNTNLHVSKHRLTVQG